MNYEIYSGLRADNLTAEEIARFRPEIKLHLETIQRARQGLSELEEAIRLVEQDDTEANAHSLACEPLQAELRDPATTAKRRIEIRQIVARENIKLELGLDAKKKVIEKMRGEFNTLRMETTRQTVLENALANLASIGLRDRYACLVNHSEWAGRRLQSEQGNINLNRERIELERTHRNPSKENVRVYESRMRHHQLLFDDASREVSRLKLELEETRQQMLAE